MVQIIPQFEINSKSIGMNGVEIEQEIIDLTILKTWINLSIEHLVVFVVFCMISDLVNLLFDNFLVYTLTFISCLWIISLVMIMYGMTRDITKTSDMSLVPRFIAEDFITVMTIMFCFFVGVFVKKTASGEKL